ncbi:hypothetical protein [Actinokineospora globicatena]|uniref:Uncharacterized protein n=1 Tax=Actinokineospora globicatena TaxID=103729 RepID=A0A9W6QR86_9PSEU|nr:hypothetical protein [Actinokineospora globicatena]GLW95431.1 hypothetical protein Aglo03_62470 [Actinokineospora globicatena]
MSYEPAHDPHRLAVATHELGHFIVWSALPGVHIEHVRVWGRGLATEGRVRVRWPKGDTEVIVRGYLVGLLAGREADRIHHDRPDAPRYREGGCAADMATFRRVRRQHEPSRLIPEAELRTEAARLIRANWARIERLALQLAARGHIAP